MLNILKSRISFFPLFPVKETILQMKTKLKMALLSHKILTVYLMNWMNKRLKIHVKAEQFLISFFFMKYLVFSKDLYMESRARFQKLELVKIKVSKIKQEE